MSDTLTLRNGTTITLRPIRVDDAPRLQALHARLSPETIYLRFLSVHLHLSDEEARRLATVNYQTTMALVATLSAPDAGEDVIIGVARYAATENNPTEAEAAIVVDDAYQGGGVGTLMLERLLLYACEHGIQTLIAEINAQNERMLHFIRRSGLKVDKRLEDGAWAIRVYLK